MKYLAYGSRLFWNDIFIGMADSVKIWPSERFLHPSPFGCKCGSLCLRFRQGKRRRNQGGNLVCMKCGRIVK